MGKVVSVDLILGDCLEVLRTLPDESFTACFCDPPYGLSKDPDMAEVLTHWLAGEEHETNEKGFMGAVWDVVPGPAVWKEAYRVLKPGAVVLVFAGTRTEDLLGIALRLAGFERFDTIAWVHAQGFPKNLAIGKAIDRELGKEREVVGQNSYASRRPNKEYKYTQKWSATLGGANSALITAPATPEAAMWEGYGTALKPSIEFILCFRKPRRATYSQTALEHGTGALWIDGCRVGTAADMNPRDFDDRRRTSPKFSGTYNDGKIGQYRSRTGAVPPGRWPPNLLLSHADGCKRVGVKRIRSSQVRTQYEGESANKKYAHQQQNVKAVGHVSPGYADADGLETVDEWECVQDGSCPIAALNAQAGHDVSRFFRRFPGEPLFYCPKASRSERDAGLEGLEPKAGGSMQANIGDVMQLGGASLKGEHKARQKTRNTHSCVKALKLCEYLARLILPPEEYRDEAALLVPFAGSGSEMIGAMQAGWRNITGIEISEEYVGIARKRIAYWQSIPVEEKLL